MCVFFFAAADGLTLMVVMFGIGLLFGGAVDPSEGLFEWI